VDIAKMRFPEIRHFSIDELSLDERNPRIGYAADQRECIEKIYRRNTKAFIEMMESLASGELAELLLVYTGDEHPVIHDGNRRAAALMVLHNPKLAPSSGIGERATSLRQASDIDFDRIAANVSDDLDLIKRTVAEKHGGGGAGRLRWNARASARYRFLNDMGEQQDWKASALLADIEEADSDYATKLEGSKFSFDAFRRVVREMVGFGIINGGVFAEGKKGLDQRVGEETIHQTREAVRWAIDQIVEKQLILSGNRRDGQVYADGDELREYLRAEFGLGEEQTVNGSGSADGETSASPGTATGESTSASTGDAADNTRHSTSESADNQQDAEGQGTPPIRPPPMHVRVHRNVAIEESLNRASFQKACRLYYSIHTVSANMHPEMVAITCWAFYEVLAKSQPQANPNERNVLSALNTRVNGFCREELLRPEDLHRALQRIRDAANTNKHSATASVVNSRQLISDMQTLERFTLSLAESMS
jgi:hypothetical protein